MTVARYHPLQHRIYQEPTDTRRLDRLSRCGEWDGKFYTHRIYQYRERKRNRIGRGQCHTALQLHDDRPHERRIERLRHCSLRYGYLSIASPHSLFLYLLYYVTFTDYKNIFEASILVYHLPPTEAPRRGRLCAHRTRDRSRECRVEYDEECG